MPEIKVTEAQVKRDDARNALIKAGLDLGKIDDIDTAHKGRYKLIQSIRQNRKSIDAVDVPGDPNKNNCFLLSIGCAHDAEAEMLRTALYDAYHLIFNSTSSDQNVQKFKEELKEKFEDEKKEGDFNETNCTKPSRMLNLADIYLISFLLTKPIHIVSTEGAIERIDASDIITKNVESEIKIKKFTDTLSRFSGKKVLYAQKQDAAHYYRVTEKSALDLIKIEENEKISAAESKKKIDEVVTNAILFLESLPLGSSKQDVVDKIEQYSRYLDTNIRHFLSDPTPEPKPVIASRAALSTDIPKEKLARYEALVRARIGKKAAFDQAKRAIDEKMQAKLRLLPTAVGNIAGLDKMKSEEKISTFLTALKFDASLNDLNVTEHRKNILSLYRYSFIIDSKDFDSVDEDAAKEIAELFGFKPADVATTKGYLSVLKKSILKQCNVKFGEKLSEDVISKALNASDRDLGSIDILIEAARLHRTIHVLNSDGSVEVFNPADMIGAPFDSNSKDGPVYIYHAGNNKYQGITLDGLTYLYEAKNEARDEKSALEKTSDKALSDDDLIINDLEAEILTASKDAAAKKKFTAYKKELIATAPVLSAADKSTGLVTDQLLVLGGIRQKLVASLPPADVSELEEKHVERDQAIKALREIEVGNGDSGRKSHFKTVLYTDPKADALDLKIKNIAAKSVDFLEALGVTDSSERKTFEGRIIEAQKALDDNNEVNKILEALYPVADIYAELKMNDELFLQWNNYTNLIEKRNEIDKEESNFNFKVNVYLAANKNKPAPAGSPEFNEYLEKTAKFESERASNNAAINSILNSEPFKSNLSIDKDMLRLEKDALNKKLNPLLSDRSVVEAAISQFKLKMLEFKTQQDGGKGDVHNIYDVQWSAILRQQPIIVVLKDGTTKTFSPDIFEQVDSAKLNQPALLAKAKAEFFKNLDVTIDSPKKDPIYIFDNQAEDDTRGYHAFTPEGQAACKGIAALDAKALTDAQHKVSDAEAAIDTLLTKVPADVQANAKVYSLLYGRTIDAIREGKPLSDAIHAPSPEQPAWEAKLARSPDAVVPVTREQDEQRDIHRQNIDVLLTLLLQGSRDRRLSFIKEYESKSSDATSVIRLDGDTPSFYAKGIALKPEPVIPSGGTPGDDILFLLRHTMQAYVELKKGSPDSALAKDYQAILAAFELKIIHRNDSNTDDIKSLNGIYAPAELKTLLQGIHERVAAKAGYVEKLVAHKIDPKEPAPHFVKQSSYVQAGKPRIVFDVKGMTVNEVREAFNHPDQSTALTIEVGGKPARVVAVDVGNRLTLKLQAEDGTISPLTKNAWNVASLKVADVLKKIANGCELSTNNEPRKRGNKP